MPKGKMGYANSPGAMRPGMGDGSRMSVPKTTMNGRIEPGMTPAMSQTKTKMSSMPTMGQEMGSISAVRKKKSY